MKPSINKPCLTNKRLYHNPRSTVRITAIIKQHRANKRNICVPFVPEGTLLRSHIPSLSSLSRISQLNIPGFSRLYSSILFSTSGVVPCFRGHRSRRVYSQASHVRTFISAALKHHLKKPWFPNSECVICTVPSVCCRRWLRV